MGVMIESNLVEGRQDIVPGQPLTYGQSVTDACISVEDTVPLLDQLARMIFLAGAKQLSEGLTSLNEQLQSTDVQSLLTMVDGMTAPVLP